MINPIGKAAMIATDCKLYIEFLANINAIGNKIKITAQNTNGIKLKKINTIR